jgi:hypothetical protein
VKEKIVQRIFNLVRDMLISGASFLKITYNEINIIVYYFLIPFSWLCMLDVIYEFHYLKLAFIIFCLGFYIGCRNFRTFSDELFMKSVYFLNYFKRFGSNYVSASVWICVVVPILIYVGLIYLIVKN